MKLLVIALTLSFLSFSAAAAGKCQIGSMDALDGSATGVRNGSELVTLPSGTPVFFIDIPSGFKMNFEVIAVAEENVVLVGSTTQFDECNRSSCDVGSVVTLSQHTSGYKGGSEIVALDKGSKVLLHGTPNGLSVNYEVIPLAHGDSILFGQTTRFQTCN